MLEITSRFHRFPWGSHNHGGGGGNKSLLTPSFDVIFHEEFDFEDLRPCSGIGTSRQCLQFHFRWYHSTAFFLENLFKGSQALKTPRDPSFDPPQFRPGWLFFPHRRVISTTRGTCLSRGSAAAAEPSKTATTNVRFQQVLTETV